MGQSGGWYQASGRVPRCATKLGARASGTTLRPPILKKPAGWRICNSTGWRLVEMETIGTFEAKTHLASLLDRTAFRRKPGWLLLGSGVVGCLTRPSLRRGRRAGLCRDGGRYARTERNRDTTVVCPARCRGAGAARSAAATRSPRWGTVKLT